MIRLLLLLAAGSATVVVAGAYLLPRVVHVERSVHVKASPEAVFGHVNALPRWAAWSPWERKDPTMAKTFTGPDAGEGATLSWTSDTQGGGTQTITRSEPPRRIETALDFGAQGTATGTWTFDAADGGTQVTWGLDADMGNSPVGRYMGLMMDRWVGPDFEEGLAALKEVVEREASMQATR